ncbi:CHAT domain-containing protein [Streptomyces doebereineriae]|uniref:CHAT domain-containing protein n=1 Tax=Streptomyces doebereineriae TaxID=3075528 RepID=A0ABU2VEQ9_9ACTN|nr:CHAT domain-containing protein [Streptomyces sp. DSM 41640]MDT0484039.1 CHAT domain-containing protein [Streptomyces sp. DSM 41640]
MATVLELQICQLHPREYEVRVVKAAAGGEPRAPLILNVDELLGQRPALENKVVFSAGPTRRVVRPSEQLVQDVGRQLFDALFSDQILGTYRASLSVAQERQEPLQIVLRLEPPELALLPWEALFDSHNDYYVCLREPIVRHLPASRTLNPLPVQLPLRILAVIASPRGLPLLDSDSERALLEEALAEQVADDLVELVWLTDASWTSLHSRLHAGPWHVLHFIGHGDYDLHYEEGQIALVGENGRAQMVEAYRLAELIALANPVPRLVVLNSCASAAGGADDGFSSVGAALVRSGISAVAAMQFSITDRASVNFAQGFYTALAHGRRVDDAVRSGRLSMFGTSRSLEWITPVLYVRGEANLLFNLNTQQQPPKETDQRKRRLYTEASEELRIGHRGKAIELLDDLLSLDPDNSDAIKLRDQAARQEQLIKAYVRAAEAEESEDWSAAIDCYEQIMQQDPDYRDTTTRRDFCRDRQRIAHLQEKLRSYASQKKWQATIDVSETLEQLDPDSADPDGLSTEARLEVAHEQYTAYLEDLYLQASEAERSEDWNTAINRYEQIMQQDPNYRDTTTRRDFCRDRQSLARSTSNGRNPVTLFAIKTLVIDTPCGAIAWGSSGRYQALAVDIWGDAQIRLYDMAGAGLLAIQTGKKGAPYVAAFSPDGTRLIGKGKKGATVWNAYTGKSVLHVPAGNGLAAATFKADGTCIATGSYDSACVWDVKTAKKIFSAAERAIQAVAFSPDGNRLIVADQRGLHVWQLDTGLKIFEDLRGFLNSVAYSPDGKRAAAGSSTDNAAYLWNPGHVHELAHNASVTSVAFGSDGTRLATGSEDGTARIWNAINAHMMCKITHDDPVSSLAFSPRGTHLATGTRRAVTVWELRYM